MCPGRAVYDVKEPGIVPGAAPMGAGLLPSTGAAGAVKMGGESPARGAGQPSFDSSTVPYVSITVKKNRYTFGPKNGQNGISRKAPNLGKN